nr:hypothetical protein BgiMline_030951 [Biomphalaria glabrata]
METQRQFRKVSITSHGNKVADGSGRGSGGLTRYRPPAAEITCHPTRGPRALVVVVDLDLTARERRFSRGDVGAVKVEQDIV